MTVCLPLDWPAPPFGIGTIGSALFTGMTIAALLLASGVIARQAFLRLEGNPQQREWAVRRYASARTYFFFAVLIAYAFCLLGLGWGATATRLGTIGYHGRPVFVPCGELLILAPFFLTQVGSWGFFYDADWAIHEAGADPARPNRFWTRPGYMVFLFRQQLILVFAPLFLLMGQQAIERFYPEITKEAWLPFASLLVLPCFLVFFPLFLPMLLGLRPLPGRPVRDRLEANARRLRFRYAQIYLWDTRGAVANAMAVGMVRPIRYVVFTDRLLDELDKEELDGVFGHEVGHVHHGHIAYYALFLMLSFVLIGVLVQAVRLMDEATWTEYRTLFLVAPVVVMGTYMFAAFGFISRRCERQADIFGCRAGSCSNLECQGHDWTTVLSDAGRGLCPTGIANFIRALRRVEEINGMVRAKPDWDGAGALGKLNWIFRLLTGWLHTWQHSTIPKRIAFLERIAENPEIERRFQSRLWALKWLVILGLIGSLLGLAAWKGWDILLMAM